MSKKLDSIFPLGLALENRNIFLFLRIKQGNITQIQLISSSDGLQFKVLAENLKIRRELNLEKCSDFHLGKLKNKDYFLTYKTFSGKKVCLKRALSQDLISWKKTKKLPFTQGETGALVSNYQWQDKYVMYFGEKQIRIAFSKNLKKWEVAKDFILKPRRGYFDAFPIGTIAPLLIKDGILLVYFIKKTSALGAALFSKKDPNKLLWRSANPIWKTREKIYPLGAVKLKEDLIFYFSSKKGEIKKLAFSLERIFSKEQSPLVLERATENPIIKPISKHAWESQYTFNPGAIYLDGRVHLVYRAIGEKGISVLGYASSKNGINFNERLNKPIYIPTRPFESQGKEPPDISCDFMSGGGYGGCEDPRLTKIKDRVYMTYIAFNGWEVPRVALTSIKVDDFLSKKWNWKRPVLISPPREIHKNWVIFPEKINGKYAILHSICPKISIAYVESLNFDGSTYINSYYNGESRKDCWDDWVRGAGPPPIKTKDGWLLLYHAMDNNDPGRYKLGAIILDFKDPSKVLYRSENPLLEPDESYENEGFKAGVVYACGAVVISNRLFIYYGGADTVICVATTDLHEFLSQLKNSKPIKLKPITISKKIFQQYAST